MQWLHGTMKAKTPSFLLLHHPQLVDVDGFSMTATTPSITPSDTHVQIGRRERQAEEKEFTYP